MAGGRWGWFLVHAGWQQAHTTFTASLHKKIRCKVHALTHGGGLLVHGAWCRETTTPANEQRFVSQSVINEIGLSVGRSVGVCRQSGSLTGRRTSEGTKEGTNDEDRRTKAGRKGEATTARGSGQWAGGRRGRQAGAVREVPRVRACARARRSVSE